MCWRAEEALAAPEPGRRSLPESNKDFVVPVVLVAVVVVVVVVVVVAVAVL